MYIYTHIHTIRLYVPLFLEICSATFLSEWLESWNRCLSEAAADSRVTDKVRPRVKAPNPKSSCESNII